jgi:hypothetical protein
MLKRRIFYLNKMFIKKNSSFVKVKNYFSNKNDLHNENSFNGEDSFPTILHQLFRLNIKDKKLPCFQVFSSQIEILDLPTDFYLAIIVYILL